MNFKKLLFLPFLVLILMVSCQDEATEITNPPQEDIIEGNSTIAGLMGRTASNDGSLDNIIDYANCLEVILPVTVTANGVTITIESFVDYDALEALLDAFTNDDDEVEITFPITVILNDYTQIVINNQAELEAQIENCNGENEDDDDIECIDFQYPIVFSIYNTDFQVTEIVTIENDEALYQFLETLNGPVLASLNFPVTLVLANGETLVVNNNQELEIAISEAEDDCDEDDDYDYNDDDCTEESIELALKECLWEITSYNTTDFFDGYYIDFNANYEFTATYNGNIIQDGNWAISQNGEGNFVIDFGTDWQDLNGAWVIENCSDDNEYNVYNMSTQSTMQIQQDCDVDPYNPFECFESFNASIELCDDGYDGYEVFNLPIAFDNCLNPNQVSVLFYETEADAQASVNPLANPQAYTNIMAPQVIYVRVELVSNPSEFQVFTLELLLENCGNTSGCDLLDIETYLQTCIWNTVNLNDSDNLIGYDLDFNTNNNLSITDTATNNTYSGYWYVSETATGSILLELANINGPNIQAISGYWDLLECDMDRLQFTNDNNAIFVIEQDCN